MKWLSIVGVLMLLVAAMLFFRHEDAAPAAVPPAAKKLLAKWHLPVWLVFAVAGTLLLILHKLLSGG